MQVTLQERDITDTPEIFCFTFRCHQWLCRCISSFGRHLSSNPESLDAEKVLLLPLRFGNRLVATKDLDSLVAPILYELTIGLILQLKGKPCTSACCMLLLLTSDGVGACLITAAVDCCRLSVKKEPFETGRTTAHIS